MLNYENERSPFKPCYVTNVDFLRRLVLLPMLFSVRGRTVIWLREKYLGCHYLAWTILMVTTKLRTCSQYNVSNILRFNASSCGSCGPRTALKPTQPHSSLQTLLVIRRTVNN